jgi:hypothetical protein
MSGCNEHRKRDEPTSAKTSLEGAHMVANQPPPNLPPGTPPAIVQGVEVYNDAQDVAHQIAEEAIKRDQEQRALDAQLANRTQTQQPY